MADRFQRLPAELIESELTSPTTDTPSTPAELSWRRRRGEPLHDKMRGGRASDLPRLTQREPDRPLSDLPLDRAPARHIGPRTENFESHGKIDCFEVLRHSADGNAIYAALGGGA